MPRPGSSFWRIHEAALPLGIAARDLDLDVLLAGARREHHLRLAALLRAGVEWLHAPVAIDNTRSSIFTTMV